MGSSDQNRSWLADHQEKLNRANAAKLAAEDTAPERAERPKAKRPKAKTKKKGKKRSR